MQGGDEGEAELQHNSRLEDIDEPTLPTQNEIDMQEGVTGVKRGQSECIENPCNGKLRRRDGIKRCYETLHRRVKKHTIPAGILRTNQRDAKEW